MQLDAEQKDIQEIFGGKSKFTIPDYQRNYAWTGENVEAFLADLKIAYEAHDEHFFGSIVLLDEGNYNYSVIDGQQRLTTFMMLTCVVRDLVHELSDKTYVKNGQATSLEGHISDLIKTNFDYELRYSANYKIHSIFRDYILLHPLDQGRKNLVKSGLGLTREQKDQTLDLRRAYAMMQNWVTELFKPYAGDEDALKRHLFDLITTIKSGAKILRIVVKNEDDAFILFETLNDRGLKLTPSDLLKSYTLRKINEAGHQAAAEEALEEWDAAVSVLPNFPFTKFLRHYLLSIQNSSKVQAKRIFSMFKDLITKYDAENPGAKEGALVNLQSLTRAANLYAQLLEGGNTGDPKLNEIVHRLNLFSETHRVFLLRVLSFNYTDGARRNAAKVVESLAFRWIITGQNAQILENAYQDAAAKLVDRDSESLDAALQELKQLIPKDDAVRASLAQQPARKDARFQFYVLKRVNMAISQTAFNWSAQQSHVEHLAPQKPLSDSGWYDSVAPKDSSDPEDKVYNDFVWMWGNLTLLEFDINTSIGNADWTTKLKGKVEKPGIDNSQIVLNEPLKRAPHWGHKEITERTVWLADAMVSISSIESITASSVSVSEYKVQ